MKINKKKAVSIMLKCAKKYPEFFDCTLPLGIPKPPPEARYLVPKEKYPPYWLLQKYNARVTEPKMTPLEGTGTN